MTDTTKTAGHTAHSEIEKHFLTIEVFIGEMEHLELAVEETVDINPAADALEAVRRIHADMLKALKESELQIEYLHEKFQPTSTGEAVLSRIRAAIQKAEGGRDNAD